MSKKYALPPFLAEEITQENYLRWLRRKSIAHVRRDKQRGNTTAVEFANSASSFPVLSYAFAST
jgi:hypothetical protein